MSEFSKGDIIEIINWDDPIIAKQISVQKIKYVQSHLVGIILEIIPKEEFKSSRRTFLLESNIKFCYKVLIGKEIIELYAENIKHI